MKESADQAKQWKLIVNDLEKENFSEYTAVIGVILALGGFTNILKSGAFNIFGIFFLLGCLLIVPYYKKHKEIKLFKSLINSN